jgi:hypothetical protein
LVPGALGILTGALGRSTLLCSIVTPPGPFPPLCMLFSEGCGSLELFGRSIQHGRELLRILRREAPRAIDSARCPVGMLGIVQLGPLAF